MDKNKQLIAIAEYCGYKNIKHIDAPDCLMADGVWADNPKHPPHVIPRIKVPDYIKDLNAMHKAENVLTIPQQLAYFQNLSQILETNPDGTHKFGVCMYWETTHANASQRAETFLRTIGKWEE
jgi:hypothetical protein